MLLGLVGNSCSGHILRCFRAKTHSSFTSPINSFQFSRSVYCATMASAAAGETRTEPVYFSDTYLFSFDKASVLKAEKLEGDSNDYAVVTDQTIMHPQGGGQPSDQGEITTSVDGTDVVFQVKQVSKAKDSQEIKHIGCFSSGSAELLPVGQTVKMTINEDMRRLHARLHSAGHLLDTALNRLNASDLIPSKGYHFADGPYVEYIGNVANEERDKLMASMNEVLSDLVKENIATQITVGDSGERIVSIAGLPCPCGGTHVKSTAEIGPMKVTRMKKNKKNMKMSYSLESS
eukprot:scpid82734/ scgid3605/ Alanyl-tRNA editing protein AlaX-L; Alanyl-tRNA deacylase AlaX-L